MHSLSALRLNNGLMMLAAAVAGLGVALLPRFIVHDELRQGALRIVDLDQTPQRAELLVAQPQDHGTSGKIQALVAHLRKAFGDPPYWEREASLL